MLTDEPQYASGDLRNYTTPESITSEIAILALDTGKLFVYTEGQDDYVALKQFGHSELEIRPGTDGKTRMLKIASLTSGRAVPNVRFLIDSDFDRIVEPKKEYSDNVLPSKNHDLFTDLVETDPCTLAREIELTFDFAFPNGRLDDTMPSASEIMSKALEIASALSAFRILNERGKYGLNFMGIKFHCLDLDADYFPQLADQVVLHSSNERLDSSDLAFEAKNIHQEYSSVRESIVGDHDYFDACASIMNRYLRKKNKNAISGKQLHHNFIRRIVPEMISKTSWGGAINELCIRMGVRGFSKKADRVR